MDDTPRLKAYIGGMVHETNVFSPIPTRFEDFDWLAPRSPSAGAPAWPLWPGYQDFCEAAEQQGLAVHRGSFCGAQPSAALDAQSYRRRREALLSDLRQAMPVDIVLLMLHGSQMAEGCDDCEGDLIGAIRAMVGPGVPVGVLLDLHTNLSARRLAAATFVMACKEYPHVDFPDCARTALALLLGAARGTLRPTSAAVRVPAFGTFPTTAPPFDAFMARLRAAESAPGVLNISALHGFFGADNPWLGASIIVVTDNEPALAAHLAQRLADDFLATICGYQSPAVGPAETLALAMAQPTSLGPVVIADHSDNPGGGAAGDSTHLLQAMLEAGIRDAALGMIWDPEAVDAAHVAGEGARLRLRVGGKAGPLSGAPLELDAQVLCLRTDAMQSFAGSSVANQPLGRSAAIRVDGVDIVLCSIRQQVFSPLCFTEHGIDPAKRHVVVVKSTQHFYAGFAPFASRVVYCDAQGSTSKDYRKLPYRKARRPLYPLDASPGQCSRIWPLNSSATA